MPHALDHGYCSCSGHFGVGRRFGDVASRTRRFARTGNRECRLSVWAHARPHPLRRGLSADQHGRRSEEHTSELQSLMRLSYAVFSLKKKTTKQEQNNTITK